MINTTSHISSIFGNLVIPKWKQLRVGIDKLYQTIQAVINAVNNDNTKIIIDAGIYNEAIDLTTKKVWLVGSGNLDTIIFLQYPVANDPPTVNVGTDSLFDNLVFDKESTIFSNPVDCTTPVLNISGCNPVFTGCKLSHAFSIKNTIPATISNGSNVTMNNCIIDAIDTTGSFFTVEDTSILNFVGISVKTHFLVKDNAVANINANIIYASSAALIGLRAEDNAVLNVTINTKQIACNGLGVELAAGNYTSLLAGLYDNASLQITGEQIVGQFEIYGDSNQVLFKDIVSTLGAFKVITVGAYRANTVIVTFDNCQTMQDLSDDVNGWHIIEDVIGAEIRLINGTVLTFGGHSGTYLLMGNPITVYGKLYMRNSTVIDNVNDNIPFGTNYPQTIRAANKIDIEDSVISNLNWDSVGVNTNIVLMKGESQHLTVNLKNVVFNNSQINSCPVYFIDYSTGIDDNDYVHYENVTKNSTAAICNEMTKWNLMLANDPTTQPLTKPSGLTLSLISGGVKVDWTDNASVSDQIEIWGRSDSGVSALLYTVNHGVQTKNDAGVTLVDLRYYKLRSKNGSDYSIYTMEKSIAMLGAETRGYPISAWATATGGWTLSGTKWIWDGITAGAIRDDLYYTPGRYVSGKHYRVRFTIADCATTTEFAFYPGQSNNFSSPFNGYVTRGNGSYEYNITCTGTCDYLWLYTRLGIATAYSIDGISIKEILMP